MRHSHEFLSFSDGLVALERMHIHLVAVKVSIEGPRGRQRQTRREALHSVAPKGHHRGLPQTRLTIKKNPVAIHKMALHDPPRPQLGSQVDASLAIQDGQPDYVINSVTRGPNGKSSAVGVRPNDHDTTKVSHVNGRHRLRKGQLIHHRGRQAQLINVVAGVARDDGASTLIDTLAVEVASDASFLAVEAALDVDDLALRRSSHQGQQALLGGSPLDGMIHKTRHHDLKLVVGHKFICSVVGV